MSLPLLVGLPFLICIPPTLCNNHIEFRDEAQLKKQIILTKSPNKLSTMFKSQLKKLLNNHEKIKIMLYFDKWNVCGRSLVWCNVKHHLKETRNVHYLCYSCHPLKCSHILRKDGIGEESLHFYDMYTDPLHWNSEQSQSELGKRSFAEVISLSRYNAESNLVVIIDKIDGAMKYLSETDILRNIQTLKNAESVLQVVLYCSEDVVSPAFASALTNLCSSSVTVMPTTPLTCALIWKKNNGKVIKCVEEFSINSEFELEFSREQKLAATKSVPSSDSQDPATAAFQTSFNLSLTENQKEAKKRLVLPHTRIQSCGGQIHYIPDTADDWDDEDPDDDLDI